MRVESIDDPQTLRTAAKLLDAENRRLRKKNLELGRRIAELESKDPAQLALQLAELERQLAMRNKKLFGRSSEKRAHSKQDDAVPGEPQRGHGPNEQTELSELEQVHELDEADRACKQCSGALSEWVGQYEASEEIDVLERRFVRIFHKRKEYRCACGSCIETAEGPKRRVPGGRYSNDFAISVAIAKYADHRVPRMRHQTPRGGRESNAA